MTLLARMLLMVTGLLVIAVVATSGLLTWNAGQLLLAQKEFEGQLIAELLARSARFAEETARDAEDAIGEQMVVEATIAAHLVASAEAAGASPEEINARLRQIADSTVLDEFWITDEHGRAYLRTAPDIDFTFSPDPVEQPQAHAFWPLLTGERVAVVQEARKREVDDQVFKYVGVAGVDQSRIVQVGYAAQFLERLRQQVGLPSLIRELVASGRVVAIQVVDPGLVTLAYSAVPGESLQRELSDIDAAYVQRAVAEGRTLSYVDGTMLKVMTPIVGTQERAIGATMVQLPMGHVRELIQDTLRLAALVAVCLVVAGLLASIVLARRLTRPVDRLTAAARAVEGGTFDPGSLNDIGARADELGQLARVFQHMAREVQVREQRLKQQVRELRIEVDEARKAREVAEITETEYFQQLQQKARRLRNRSAPAEA